jgi:hypothetical protein
MQVDKARFMAVAIRTQGMLEYISCDLVFRCCNNDGSVSSMFVRASSKMFQAA